MWVEEHKSWGLGRFNIHGAFEIRLEKLEEENRRRMLRLAQPEIAEKDKRRNGRVFFKAR